MDKNEEPNERNIAVEIAGWYGAVAIVLAYVLVSFNVLSARGGAYQLLNLTGAIGIVIISLAKKVSQPVVINIFWATVALIALARLLIR